MVLLLLADISEVISYTTTTILATSAIIIERGAAAQVYKSVANSPVRAVSQHEIKLIFKKSTQQLLFLAAIMTVIKMLSAQENSLTITEIGTALNFTILYALNNLFLIHELQKGPLRFVRARTAIELLTAILIIIIYKSSVTINLSTYLLSKSLIYLILVVSIYIYLKSETIKANYQHQGIEKRIQASSISSALVGVAMSQLFSTNFALNYSQSGIWYQAISASTAVLTSLIFAKITNREKLTIKTINIIFLLNIIIVILAYIVINYIPQESLSTPAIRAMQSTQLFELITVFFMATSLCLLPSVLSFLRQTPQFIDKSWGMLICTAFFVLCGLMTGTSALIIGAIIFPLSYIYVSIIKLKT